MLETKREDNKTTVRRDLKAPVPPKLLKWLEAETVGYGKLVVLAENAGLSKDTIRSARQSGMATQHVINTLLKCANLQTVAA